MGVLGDGVFLVRSLEYLLLGSLVEPLLVGRWMRWRGFEVGATAIFASVGSLAVERSLKSPALARNGVLCREVGNDRGGLGWRGFGFSSLVGFGTVGVA